MCLAPAGGYARKMASAAALISFLLNRLAFAGDFGLLPPLNGMILLLGILV